MQKYIWPLLALTLFSCKKNTEVLDVTTEKFNNPLSSGIDSAVHAAYLKHKDSVNTIGMSIGLYKNGKIYNYGYGETVKGNKTPPNEKTFFEIGSITKTYTAIATHLMLLEKKQTINQTIRELLPDSIPVLQKEGVEVTIKHLLNHTSGIPYFPGNFDIFNTAEELAESIKIYDKNKLFSYLKQNPVSFKPGEFFEYSNTTYGLMGVLLEEHYKKSYSKILQEKIFNPLSLSETKTLIEQTDLTRWSKGYEDGEPVSYLNDWSVLAGSGVLKSTLHDVLKYGIANLMPPTGLLGEAIKQSHQVSYLPFSDAGRFKINGRLGWFQYINNEVPNSRFIFHNGSTGGFNSELFISTETNTVLVILFNTRYTGSDRQGFIRDLHKIMLQ